MSRPSDESSSAHKRALFGIAIRHTPVQNWRVTYVFETIYDASTFHWRVYAFSVGLIACGFCVTTLSAMIAWRFAVDGQVRARFDAPRFRLSLSLLLVIGPVLLVIGGRGLTGAIHRARGFAADLQSPRAVTVEGIVTDFSRDDRNGNSRPTRFTLGSLPFAYDWNSETFNATVRKNGPIFEGRHVRLTYMPPPPGQPVTEILRVEVGTPISRS